MSQTSNNNQNVRERNVKILNEIQKEFDYTDYRDMEDVGTHEFYPVINGSEIYGKSSVRCPLVPNLN